MSHFFFLKVIQGHDKGNELFFDSQTVSIGRAGEKNDLILNNQEISSHHARLSVQGRKAYIEDLNSTNGTWINGSRIEPFVKFELSDGSEIDIGPYCFRLILNSGMDRTLVASNPDKPRKTKKTTKTETGKQLKTKPIKITLAVILSVFTLLLIFDMVTPGGEKTSGGVKKEESLSDQAIALPGTRIYGYLPKKGIRSRREKAVFTFKTRKGSAYLTYKPGYIDSESELSIFLNKQQISYATPCGNGWGKPVKLHLPLVFLNSDNENQITFKNNLIENKKNIWAVKELSVLFDEGGFCDEQEILKLSDLGKSTYDEKTISAKNLYLSISYYKQALVKLDHCPSQVGRYQQILDRVNQIRGELDAMYRNLLFSLKKSQKLSDDKLTIDILEDIIQLIPDSGDPRYLKAIDLLNEINSKNK